jgi:hypothetical protein
MVCDPQEVCDARSVTLDQQPPSGRTWTSRGRLAVRRAVRRALERVLARAGYALTSTRPGPVRPVHAVKTPTDAVYIFGDLAFEVPIAKCSNEFLFSYGADAWNPFVETLRAYGDGLHARYDISVLRRYFEKFQPRNHVELYFGDGEADGTLARCDWSQCPIDVLAPRLPWQQRSVRVTGPSAWYGPVSLAQAQLEFSRLTRVYDSIRRNGYKPTSAPDGEIRGHFLRGNGDYRFVVREGCHRLAALAALGHDSVRVRFLPHHPRTVDLVDVDNWPQVREGFIGAREAERVCAMFFSDVRHRRRLA